MEIMHASVFLKESFELGESPFYDPRVQRYSWVDIIRGQVWTMDGSGKRSCCECGQPVGAAVPVKDREGLLLFGKDGIYYLENNAMTKIRDLTDVFKPFLRSNDAKADPMGRVFFGSSLAEDGYEPQGDLYRYDETGIKLMEKHTKIANGMAWNKAKDRFYFADSEEHAVFVYDYDVKTGDICNKRVLFTVEDGVPDGLCIDCRDQLYTAVWGGSRIEKRSGLTGEKLAEIRVDARQVTSCCFGGEKRTTLFITTAKTGQTGEYDGSLFCFETGEEGPEPDYAVL